MRTIEEFMEEVKVNEELKDALVQAVNDDKVQEFMKEKEISGKLMEFEKEITHLIKNGKEVSDDDLTGIVGGAMNYAEGGRSTSPSEVKFIFKVGDRVETCYCGAWSRRGTITKCYIYDFLNWDNGKHSYYPCYIVKLDNGSVKDLWQSDISY